MENLFRISHELVHSVLKTTPCYYVHFEDRENEAHLRAVGQGGGSYSWWAEEPANNEELVLLTTTFSVSHVDMAWEGMSADKNDESVYWLEEISIPDVRYDKNAKAS